MGAVGAPSPDCTGMANDRVRPNSVELYQKLLQENDPAKQRGLMREFEKYVLDTQVHEIVLPWQYRIIPQRSYVKGWAISPSHYINQDLAVVWLDRN
jgi:peptide/nickel transport system substrate-binding protein